MKKSWLGSFALAMLGMGMMQGPVDVPKTGMTAVSATTRAAISEWDQKIGALSTRGDLKVLSVREDTMLPGRTHTRYEQLYRGVPVWGGAVARQEDAAGTLSVFGGLFDGIDIETRPSLGEAAARSALLKRSPAGSAIPETEPVAW